MWILSVGGDINSANFALNSTDQNSVTYSVNNLDLNIAVDIQTVLFGIYTESQTANLLIPNLTASLGIGFAQD